MSLLQMSFYGGVMISVILLLRAVLGRWLPKYSFVVLWGAVLLRLLLPVQISAEFSVYSVTENMEDAMRGKEATGNADENINPVGGVGGFTLSTTEAYDKAGTGRDSTGINAVGTGSGVSIFAAVRRMGTLVCSLGFLALYVNCLRMFCTSLPVENEFIRIWLKRHRLRRFVAVRQSDRIGTPLTYGVLHPVILLPARFAGEENEKLDYILQHELVHIRRFDAVLKLAMAAALCLHWFNPLVWVMYVVMNKDVEMSCDEKVLGRLGIEARKKYALTLIEMEEKRYAFLPLHSGFGRNAIEERVRRIMKYKKTTWIAIIAATVLVFAVVLPFATSAADDRRSGQNASAGSNTEEDKNAEAEAGEQIPQDPPAEVQTTQPLPAADASDKEKAEEGKSNIEGGMQVPAWANVSFAPEEYSLTYTLEGMEETEAAWLVYGRGYCILIPTEGWTMYAPDAWMAEVNEAVQLWVTHFTGVGAELTESSDAGLRESAAAGLTEKEPEQKSWEQIKESLIAEGYEAVGNADLQLQRKNDGKTTMVEIRKNGSDTWGVFYTFPDEAIEGWGSRLAVMARHFGILPNQDSGISEVDSKALEAANAFVAAFLEKDVEGMQAYMKEGLEVYFADFALSDPVVKSVKEEGAPGRIEVSVEMKQGSEADSLVYMYLELERQEETWQVVSYGLEM